MLRGSHKLCIGFFCALLCSALSCVYTSNSISINGVSHKIDDTTVRILLFRSTGPVTVSSSKGIRISEITPGEAHLKKADSILISPEKLINVTHVEALNSIIEVNAKRYRGAIELRKVKGFIYVINIVKATGYLMSVVPGEIPAGWEREALKAQAVAARTYLFHHLGRSRGRGDLYDLASDSSSQVYKGMEAEKPSTTDAVLATSGEIILHKNMPIASFFHSTCGGKTIDGKYIWGGNDVTYLRGVACDFCKESTKYAWESQFTLEELRAYLHKGRGPIGAIKGISFKKKDGRVVEASIVHAGGRVTLSGNDFRLLFPEDKIKSLCFTSKKITSGLALSGRGWGHGVGMCQWGARGMAKKGFAYKSILRHYYSNITIDRVQNNYAASGSRHYNYN